MDSLTPSGTLKQRAVRLPERPSIRTVRDAHRYGTAGILQRGAGAAWRRRNAENFERSLAEQERHELSGFGTAMGHLWGQVVRRDGAVVDLGLMSCRLVTTAGVNFLVDALQGLVEPELLRFHGLGTGTAAEAVGDTALATELTTQYSTASTRPTGTLGEQAGNANVFETTATITVSAAVGVTEHGIFSQAAVPGGTLLDRTVFAVVNLASGESLQAVYRLTLPAGG